MLLLRTPAVIILLGLLWTSVCAADVLITPGDFGPPSPVMQYGMEGLLLTNPESSAHSHTQFAYPSDLVGAATLEIKIYFLPDSSIPGDVDFSLVLSTHNVGDHFTGPPYFGVTGEPPVPVSSSTTIYCQTFTTLSIPEERELFSIAIARNLGTSDDYPTGVYLHAVTVRDVSAGAVQESQSEPVPQAASLRVSPQGLSWGKRAS